MVGWGEYQRQERWVGVSWIVDVDEYNKGWVSVLKGGWVSWSVGECPGVWVSVLEGWWVSWRVDECPEWWMSVIKGGWSGLIVSSKGCTVSWKTSIKVQCCRLSWTSKISWDDRVQVLCHVIASSLQCLYTVDLAATVRQGWCHGHLCCYHTSDKVLSGAFGETIPTSYLRSMQAVTVPTLARFCTLVSSATLGNLQLASICHVQWWGHTVSVLRPHSVSVEATQCQCWGHTVKVEIMATVLWNEEYRVTCDIKQQTWAPNQWMCPWILYQFSVYHTWWL